MSMNFKQFLTLKRVKENKTKSQKKALELERLDRSIMVDNTDEKISHKDTINIIQRSDSR